MRITAQIPRREAPTWKKQLWGYFSNRTKEDNRELITLPKLDFLEKYYEETKETSLDKRTARDIRKSYCK